MKNREESKPANSKIYSLFHVHYSLITNRGWIYVENPEVQDI